MYLQSIATAVPPVALTQARCWELARESPLRERLNRRSQVILQSILKGDSGISRRHFCVNDFGRIFDYSADELNALFRQEAPRLAAAALASALAKAGCLAKEVDALLICTCTGYLCPGLTSYVSEALGLRSDVQLQDLVGLGCGAAVPMLRSAGGVCAQAPDALVACVAVEVCSSAFYIDDDLGVLVSACLFGDGAAATLWRGRPGAGTPKLSSFSTYHEPKNRDRIRFELREGKLRNLLHPSVPQLAAGAVSQLFRDEQARSSRPIGRILAHPGGRDVLDALTQCLPSGYNFAESRTVLRNYGNMSSPTVLFALEEALQHGVPDAADWWIVSFGAGFSAHGCRLAAD